MIKMKAKDLIKVIAIMADEKVENSKLRDEVRSLSAKNVALNKIIYNETVEETKNDG